MSIKLGVVEINGAFVNLLARKFIISGAGKIGVTRHVQVCAHTFLFMSSPFCFPGSTHCCVCICTCKLHKMDSITHSFFLLTTEEAFPQSSYVSQISGDTKEPLFLQNRLSVQVSHTLHHDGMDDPLGKRICR